MKICGVSECVQIDVEICPKYINLFFGGGAALFPALLLDVVGLEELFLFVPAVLPEIIQLVCIFQL